MARITRNTMRLQNKRHGSSSNNNKYAISLVWLALSSSLCWSNDIHVLPSTHAFTTSQPLSVQRRLRASTRSFSATTNSTIISSLEILSSVVTANDAVSSPRSDPAEARVSRKTVETTARIAKRVGTVVAILLSVTLATQHLPRSLQEALLSRRENMLAGAAIFTLGDLGAQFLTLNQQQQQQHQSQATPLDAQRLLTSTGLGMVWAGLCVPAIYGTADRLVPGPRTTGRILTKMLLSCSFLSTVGNYVTMFVRRWVKVVLSPRSDKWPTQLRRCVRSCNQDIVKVIMNAFKLWPIYDTLCFAFIPPSVRPVSTATVSALWSMYVSLASANKSNPSQETQAAL